MLEQFSPDVALVDVRLGRSSGLDVVAALKNRKPPVLTVVMTAYVAADTAIEALRRGAYDYLTKPFDPSELFATLDRCFERIDLERARREAEAARQKSESRLRAIFENSLDLIAVVEPVDGFVKFVSPSVQRLLGYAPSRRGAQPVLRLRAPRGPGAGRAGHDHLSIRAWRHLHRRAAFQAPGPVLALVRCRRPGAGGGSRHRRRDDLRPRRDRAPGDGGTAAAGPAAGSGRATDGRGRARLQQPAGGHHGQPGPAQAEHARPARGDAAGRGGNARLRARGDADPAVARLLSPADIESARRRPERPGEEHDRSDRPGHRRPGAAGHRPRVRSVALYRGCRPARDRLAEPGHQRPGRDDRRGQRCASAPATSTCRAIARLRQTAAASPTSAWTSRTPAPASRPSCASASSSRSSRPRPPVEAPAWA